MLAKGSYPLEDNKMHQTASTDSKTIHSPEGFPPQRQQYQSAKQGASGGTQLWEIMEKWIALRFGYGVVPVYAPVGAPWAS